MMLRPHAWKLLLLPTSLLLRLVAVRAIHGDSICTPYLCVNATLDFPDSREATYVLESQADDPGWMAMGFGTGMIGHPMVIMWTNSNGEVVISQRQATAHAMPQVVSVPPRIATVRQDLVRTSGSRPRFAFMVPHDPTITTQPIMWAWSPERPLSPGRPDSPIMQHSGRGVAVLNLTQFISDPQPSSTAPLEGSIQPSREASTGSFSPPFTRSVSTAAPSGTPASPGGNGSVGRRGEVLGAVFVSAVVGVLFGGLWIV